jgi:hypothetical protein
VVVVVVAFHLAVAVDRQMVVFAEVSDEQFVLIDRVAVAVEVQLLCPPLVVEVEAVALQLHHSMVCPTVVLVVADRLLRRLELLVLAVMVIQLHQPVAVAEVL